MASSTSTDTVNVQKSSSGTRRRRSVSQHKWLWGYVLSGIFSVTVSESLLRRLPVSYCKLHVHLLPLWHSWSVLGKSEALPACFQSNIFIVLGNF